jgi:hypothetical protein
MPYDGDEVTEQQNKRGTDIKQKELHKSPASSSHFRQRTLVASRRTYIHPTTYVTCTFSKTGNGYSWGLAEPELSGTALGSCASMARVMVNTARATYVRYRTARALPGNLWSPSSRSKRRGTATRNRQRHRNPRRELGYHHATARIARCATSVVAHGSSLNFRGSLGALPAISWISFPRNRPVAGLCEEHSQPA